jgi:hypothetical protein
MVRAMIASSKCGVAVMVKVVEVLDAVMGSGKTTGVLKWVDANPDKRYIYVSPLLSEVEEGGRVSDALNHVVFVSPSYIDGDDSYDKKADHLLGLLKGGCNVSCTHQLYLSMTDEHLKWIELHKYILIIDEEVNVIDGMSVYAYSDIKWLLDHNHVSISESDGMVSWNHSEKIGKHHRYEFLKQLCDSESLYATKRSDSILVTQLPVRLITCAERVIILTYMFKGNILDCFLRLKGIETKPFLDVVVTDVDMGSVRNLVSIVPAPRNFKLKGKLSSTWWKSASTLEVKAVSNAILSVCRSIGQPAENVMYTLPKSRFHKTGRQVVVSPAGYRQYKDEDGVVQYCWLPCFTRATNEYAHKNVLIHAYKRHPLQSVNAYLQDYGHPIDIEVFALSELLQWVWRSAIRNGEPISVCILSDKMLRLFQTWLGGDLE